MSYGKKFDFRRQLKNMTLSELKLIREYHMGYMLKFIGINDDEADTHSRYVSYIDVAIKKKSLIK